MGPAQAIRIGLARSFQISGRATRPEFWWFAPPVLAFAYFGTVIVSKTADLQPELIAPTFLFLVTTIPAWTAAVRRQHDAGRSSGTIVALLCAVLILTIISYLFVKFGNAVCNDDPDCDPFLPQSQAVGALGLLFGIPAIFAMFATPFFAVAALLICGKPTQPGPNLYGPNPSEAQK